MACAALIAIHKEPNTNTWLTRCFAGLLLVLPFVPAVADDPDDKEIARLVKQLGSSDFRIREAATKRLTEIGEPALDPLRNVTTPLESRRRAEQIVAVLDKKYYGEPLRLTGHTSHVWSVSVSADGKRVLTSSTDKTLRPRGQSLHRGGGMVQCVQRLGEPSTRYRRARYPRG